MERAAAPLTGAPNLPAPPASVPSGVVGVEGDARGEQNASISAPRAEKGTPQMEASLPHTAVQPPPDIDDDDDDEEAEEEVVEAAGAGHQEVVEDSRAPDEGEASGMRHSRSAASEGLAARPESRSILQGLEIRPA